MKADSEGASAREQAGQKRAFPASRLWLLLKENLSLHTFGLRLSGPGKSGRGPTEKLMTIFAEDDTLAGGCESCFPLLERAAEAVSAHFGLPKQTELEVNFYDAETMREINDSTRGVDAVTDVLSYPALFFERPGEIAADLNPDGINPESGNFMLGGVLLCRQKIEEQAKEYGHSFERELCYLFVHGCLHLLGFDHMEEADKAAMRREEKAVMADLGLPDGEDA